jgi:translation initiation factor 2 subunit 2
VRRKELDPSSFSRPKEDLDNSDVLMEMPLVDPASYSYTDLLDFFNVLLGGGENQGLASIKPPAVSRFGAKKTAWSNFVEICESLNREEDHLKDFIFSELGTDGAKDAQQRLLLKGKFNPRNIESLLRRYIIAYVQCTMCRSLDTELKRDPANRLYFMHCNACRSSKSVANIKKGFHATTKQDRREARK